MVFAEPKTSAAARNLFYNLRELGQPEGCFRGLVADSATISRAKGFDGLDIARRVPDELVQPGENVGKL